jgi:hypothetical protein
MTKQSSHKKTDLYVLEWLVEIKIILHLLVYMISHPHPT